VDALIVVDMQVGLLSGAPKHDLQGVVDRINVHRRRYGAKAARSSGSDTAETALMDLNAALRDGRFFPICSAAMRILLSKKL
jgi:nicotinamidase-related amidase